MDFANNGLPVQNYDVFTVTFKAEANEDGTTGVSWWCRGNLAAEGDKETATAGFSGFFDLFTTLIKAKFPGN